jgi:hypothetical protein
MYKLEHHNSYRLLESFIFSSKQLCNWKKNQLINEGYKLGTFKVIKIG